MSLVCIMVGLPARGKSYLSEIIKNKSKIRTKIFNVGELRRKKFGYQDFSFYDSFDKGFNEKREKIALETFSKLLEWIKSDIDEKMGIFDATNITKERRNSLLKISKENGVDNFLFIELICTDENIIRENVKTKLSNDDYKEFSRMNKNLDRKILKEKFLLDFRKRIEEKEKVYEHVGDEVDRIVVLNKNKKIEYSFDEESEGNQLKKKIFHLIRKLYVET